MNTKSQEIEKTELELRQLSFRLENITFYILQLKRELQELHIHEKQMESHLETLRISYLTIAVFEYKNVKDSLSRIRTRTGLLMTDLKNHERLLEHTQIATNKCREKLATLIRNRNGKVIQGRFGKKNGQG